MSIDPEQPPPITSTPQGNPRPGTLSWLLPLWVIMQSVAVLVAAPVVLGMLSYGLAHSSSADSAAFLVLFAGVFLVLAGSPLALLRKGGGTVLKIMKVVGGVVLLAGLAGLCLLAFGLLIDPVQQERRFRQSIEGIEIIEVEETPERIAGQIAGLHIAATMQLPRGFTFDALNYSLEDRIGAAAHEFIRDVRLGTLEHAGNGLGWAPFMAVGKPRITVDGSPIESRGGNQAYVERGHFGEFTLPAGTYRIENIFWFAGIGGAQQFQPDGSVVEVQCIEALSDYINEGLAFADGRELGATFSGRFSLGGRRGYRGHGASRPLAFRYDHARWLAARSALPLPTCEDVRAKYLVDKPVFDDAALAHERQREAAGFAEAKRLQTRDSFADSVGHSICWSNADNLASLLRREQSVFELRESELGCLLADEKRDMFDLAVPALHARDANHRQYCDLLGRFHDTGNMPMLRRLAALDLPLSCGGAHQDRWRNGLNPSTATRSHLELPVRGVDDPSILEWLRLLETSGVAICSPADDGSTLLQHVVMHYGAPIIEYLLEAGCDPHAVPPRVPVLKHASAEQAADRFQPILPVAGWTLRRFRHAADALTSPIDPSRIALISQRMGDLRADEINLLEYRVPTDRTGYATPFGEAFLVAFRQQIAKEPRLLAYLVDHGARLDVSSRYGEKWFEGLPPGVAAGHLPGVSGPAPTSTELPRRE